MFVVSFSFFSVCMGLLVNLQVGFGHGSIVAFVTLEWLFPRVQLSMHPEYARRPESLMADRTLVWPLSRVNPFVMRKRRGFGESLATHVTLDWVELFLEHF